MAGKLKHILKDYRQIAMSRPRRRGLAPGIGQRPADIASVKRVFLKPILITDPYSEVTGQTKEGRESGRREVYKKELQSLAKHGTRTEGKTITFAHPLQTFARRRVKDIGEEYIIPGHGQSYHPMVSIKAGESRGAHVMPHMIREMTKAKRYTKLLKKFAKKAGPLGLAVSAFDIIGKSE